MVFLDNSFTVCVEIVGVTFLISTFAASLFKLSIYLSKLFDIPYNFYVDQFLCDGVINGFLSGSGVGSDYDFGVDDFSTLTSLDGNRGY